MKLPTPEGPRREARTEVVNNLSGQRTPISRAKGPTNQDEARRRLVGTADSTRTQWGTTRAVSRLVDGPLIKGFTPRTGSCVQNITQEQEQDMIAAARSITQSKQGQHKIWIWSNLAFHHPWVPGFPGSRGLLFGCTLPVGWAAQHAPSRSLGACIIASRTLTENMPRSASLLLPLDSRGSGGEADQLHLRGYPNIPSPQSFPPILH